MKTCSKCLNSKDVLTIYCKDCQKQKENKYYQNNKEKIKKYYQDNIENKKEYGKQYREKNKEKIRQKDKENYQKKKALKPIKEKKVKEKKTRVLTEEQKIKYKLYWKEYRQINKERYRENKRIYKKIRKQNDPIFKIREACRKTIYMSIKRNGYSKKTKTYEILGCSYEDFKTHIELQFQTWMNWNNYGLCNNEFNYGWDIDHIVPLASAKTEEELLKLNHYTNLQPLCSHTNRNIKKDKLDF
jgi:hypothetical protein